MRFFSVCLATLVIAPLSVYATSSTINVDLLSADPFAVLAGSTLTNTGPTVIYGDVGVSPGSAITGFPPGVVAAGTIHNADAAAAQAQYDLTSAYNAAAGAPCEMVLTGQDLGALTLTPGVYCFASSAQLTGTLTLDDQGDPNALFLFQIGTTLTTASGSSVIFANTGQTGPGGANVFWQIGSSATLGTTTAFAGTILALTSITLNTGANIDCGRALALNGAVTLDTNQLSTVGCTAAIVAGVAEPPTASLLLLIGGPGLLWLRRLRRR